MSKKKECPFETLKGKLENIDANLSKLKENLETLQKDFEEECADEKESEKSLQRALDAYFVEELLKQKPVGEA